MGGNGYVEEAPFARFYREAPLNSIWEGSGNVMCLDVLRAMSRVPEVRDALAKRSAAGARRAIGRYDAFGRSAGRLIWARRTSTKAKRAH